MFQFTHPRGVRRLRAGRLQVGTTFQFTHPRGVRRLRAGRLQVGTTFQFTHPQGVRLIRVLDIQRCGVVSIHAPARGATILPYCRSRQSDVSIHAPARGATDQEPLQPALRDVSIHAPARGATLPEGIFTTTGEDVSIHAPARGATYDRQHKQNRAAVSIHAPARGATYHRVGHSRRRRRFNSRTREGCDPAMSTMLIPMSRFQFTHPRGVRPWCGGSGGELFGFQFTHPRGVRRSPKSDNLTSFVVSIHAPARGATSACTIWTTSTMSFNSRTREGCDITAYQLADEIGVFQFTHPRGVRHGAQSLAVQYCAFQFTHPRGVRPSNAVNLFPDKVVSIHAPARGATYSSVI